MFIKYHHVERLGTDEVEGILDGECYVFPKLDGTNASVWIEGGQLCAGSRRRKLTLEQDNAGFLAYILDSEITAPLIALLIANPSLTLYGEWLVPHSLKTYREDAWRRFYVFDVYDREAERLLPYDEYSTMICDSAIQVIPPMRVVSRPTEEWLVKLLDSNTYLITDGQGCGEGLVIKRYDYVNAYGRMTWAKLVRNEFKEKNLKAFGVPNVQMTNLEYKIAETFLTQPVVDKVYADMTAEEPWRSRRIPELLGRVWHDFVVEEIWEVLKRYRNPTIDFRRLHRYVVARIKALRPDLF